MDITKEIELLQNKLANHNHVKHVMANFKTYDVIRQLHIDFFYLTNSFPRGWRKMPMSISSIVKRDDTLRVRCSNLYCDYKVNYEQIADKANGLTESGVEWRFEIKREYRGVTFFMEDYMMADLPAEEMILLKSLGKVKEEIVPASVNTSIYCENPNEL